MKITINALPTVTLEEFADQYDLEMVVTERGHLPENSPNRFYASFPNIEVKEGTCGLVSASGNGNTPEEAIADYACRLHRQRLVRDAYRETRVDIAPHNFRGTQG